MITHSLPAGFRWTWIGDTVRVDLPETETMDGHVYEPVLSHRDVDRIAAAIEAQEAKYLRAGSNRRLAHIRLPRDSRYSRAAVSKFREQLFVALIERGLAVTIDDRTTMTDSIHLH